MNLDRTACTATDLIVRGESSWYSTVVVFNRRRMQTHQVCVVAFVVVFFVGIAGTVMFGVSFSRCNVFDEAAPVWRVTPLPMFGQCSVDFSYAGGMRNGTLQTACPGGAAEQAIKPTPAPTAQFVAVCYSAFDAGRYDADVDASKIRRRFVLVPTDTAVALRFAGLAMAIPLWVSVAALVASLIAALIVSCVTTTAAGGGVPSYDDAGPLAVSRGDPDAAVVVAAAAPPPPSKDATDAAVVEIVVNARAVP